jgi:hypothetical protein
VISNTVVEIILDRIGQVLGKKSWHLVNNNIYYTQGTTMEIAILLLSVVFGGAILVAGAAFIIAVLK